MDTNNYNDLVEFIKCKNDPIYFIKNYFNDYTLPEPQPLKKIYDRQIEIINTLLNDHFLILMGSRQVGKTIILIAFICWLILFNNNYLVAILSRKVDFTNDLINEVKKALSSLNSPFNIQLENKGKHSKKNLASELILINGSSVKAITVPKANPEEAGRGLRAGFIFIDEAAHINSLEKILTGINFTTARTFPRYEEMKIPFGICIASTPNGMNGTGKLFYDYWTNAINNNSLYKAVKFHWSEVPEYNREWYENQCRKLNNDRRAIAQELDLIFLASEDSFLEEDIILNLQRINTSNNIIRKIRISDSGNLYFNIFKEPNISSLYLIGIDSATKRGNDFSAICVTDFFTGEQVAEFFGKCSITDLCEKVLTVVVNEYSNCILIPENNGVGNQVIEYCQKHYNNKLFNTPRKELRKITYSPGFLNTVITRPQLLDSIYQVLKEFPESVKSEYLKMQLIGLHITGNRVEGDIDDAVFAFGFTQCVRIYYNNIVSSMFSLRNESISDMVNLFKERYEDDSLFTEQNNMFNNKYNDPIFESFKSTFFKKDKDE